MLDKLTQDNILRVSKKINKVVARAVVLILFVLFPVILHDKLNDITVTRYKVFIFTSFIAFVSIIINIGITYIMLIIKSGELTKKDINSKYKVLQDNFNILKENNIYNVQKSDIIAIVLVGVSLCSYIFSEYKEYALAGVASRYIGLWFMLALAIVYLIVSKYYILNSIDIFLAMIVGVIVNVFAVINFIGIDILGFLIGLNESEVLVFISTIGNVDVYGVYAVMITVISLVFMIREQQFNKKIIYMVFSFIGIMGIIASGSDAAFVGIAVFVALIFFTLNKNYEDISEWGIILMMMFVAEKVMRCLQVFFISQARPLQGMFLIIDKYISTYAIIILFIFVSGMKYLSNKNNSDFDSAILKKIRNIYTAVLVVSVLICVAIVIYFTSIGSVERIPALEPYIVINDNWGTGRGFIWKNLLNGYAHLPFINKIFGAGEATVRNILSDYSTQHWNLLYGSVIDNAHSVPLQMFVTMGIVGLLMYLCMFIYSVKMLLNKISDTSQTSRFYVALGFVIISIFVQYTFCILETVTFPMFIVMMAMLNSQIIENNT